MAAHPELEAEQAHVDRAYRRLDAMRSAAAGMLQEAFSQGAGGTHQARNERDVMVRTSLSRLEQLELGRESLIFGRIDREGGDRFHIGRLAVSDEDQEPLVVDWRAPVVEPFYRATGRHPMGLTRRRHFLTDERLVTGIEDEVFAIGGNGEAVEGTGLAGPGALLAALERSRSGHMRDIVATVQREQDEIIRAPLPGVLVVQGGPGTGKTAVVLHRAAYLLYTYRFPLERQGVLVVGPNPLFLRYIEQVLPSLGESGAELSTISGLLDVPVRGSDEPAAGRLKGDRRMVTFLRRAVGDRQRPLSRDLEVGWGAYTLGLPVAASAGMVSSLKRRSGTHNARRRQLEAMVFRHLFGEHQAAERRLHRTGLRPPSDDGAGAPEAGAREELTLAELTSSLRRNETVVAALDRMWPLLTPEELLHDLFGAPALVKLAGRGVLSPPDQQLLHRSRSLSLDVVPWTDDDIPLLDEALVILGPRRRLSPDDSAMRTYGHIAVDEAQDLSPMQLRMVGRRSLSGSMTVVGDVAQATGHWAPSSWDDVLAHLPTRRGSQVSELTVNYRTPSEVMDLASLVLAQVAPGVRPPTSVRSSGSRPTIVHAAGPDLGSVLGQMVQSELDAVEGGTVAVICARSSTSTVVSRLRAVGVVPGDAGRTGLEAPVTVIPVELVKGLEFDSVIVVEPARLVREADQGLRALYVALTRATRRLSLLHSEPLPPVLV